MKLILFLVYKVLSIVFKGNTDVTSSSMFAVLECSQETTGYFVKIPILAY